jgi:hypothetical protein
VDEQLLQVPEVKKYLDQRVQEYMTGYLADKSLQTAQLAQTAQSAKEFKMADGVTDNVKINNSATDPNAAMMMMAAQAGKGGGDGLFGAGGGGLLGGLLLGSLLRNGNLLGGGDANGVPAVTAQGQANMSIMATLGDIKQGIAVGTAQMETSQALQSSTLQAQMSQIAAATVAQVSGVKDAVNSNTVALMQMINGVTKDISNDGEKTRALITSQYESSLNRQLSDANAAIIELRSNERARTAEINVTQTVNQAQAQTQQQQQQQLINERLSNLLASHQYLQQGIVNLGTMSGSAGQQTAANTRVN